MIPTIHERERFCRTDRPERCVVFGARVELGAALPTVLHEVLLTAPTRERAGRRLLIHARELLEHHRGEVRAAAEEAWEHDPARELLAAAGVVIERALRGAPLGPLPMVEPVAFGAEVAAALARVARTLRWLARHQEPEGPPEIDRLRASRVCELAADLVDAGVGPAERAVSPP